MSTLHQPLVEQYVISCCLKDNNFIDRTQSYFLSNTGKVLFASMEGLRKKKIDINNSNLILECSSRGVNIDGEKINTLRELEVDLETFNSYHKDLKKYFLKNQIKTNQIKNLILEVEKENADFEKIEDILDECKTSVEEVLNRSVPYYDLESLFEDHKSIIIKRSKGEDCYPTGIRLLDKYNTIGYYPKYITTIFGSSGSGKTTVACNLVNASINLQIPTVYDSLELSKQFVTDKIIALRNGIPFSMMMEAKDEEGEDVSSSLVEMVEAEREKLAKHNRFVLMEEVNQSISDLDYEIPHIKKFMNTNFLVLHLDLATMIKDFNSNNGGDSTAGTYEKALNKLHELARKHNIHIVNYVQALRDQHNITIKTIEDIEKFRLRLSSIKNSSAFEERSRVVIGLFRPYYYAERYLKDDPRFELMTNVLEMQFLKQSLGSLPTLEFFFKGDTGRIFPFREKIEEHDLNDKEFNKSY